MAELLVKPLSCKKAKLQLLTMNALLVSEVCLEMIINDMAD